MEIRLGSILLAAALLSGCSWFHRGEPPQKQVVAEDTDTDPSIIEPQVTRREVKTPKIKAKDFEIGAYFGALSIQDFGVNPVYGARLAYHVSEDVFFEGFLGTSKAGTTSLEDEFPDITVVSNAGRQFTYYDLDLGYNVLPGEVFIGRGRAFNSQLYVTVGIGDVKFAETDQFALNFGVGERFLITDWLALHLDVRDHIFETSLTGRTKNVDNIEATLGLTTFFLRTLPAITLERSMHQSVAAYCRKFTLGLALIASAAFAADAGGPAPSFTLPDMAGVREALSQYKGQVVMVNFWATWCGPCQQEMPLLDQMYKKYKAAGFTLIGVNVDKEAPAVKELLSRKPVSFPVLLDPANEVSKAYHVDEMPSSVIIDRKGEIRYVHRGYKPGDENDYQDRIRQLIRE